MKSVIKKILNHLLNDHQKIALASLVLEFRISRYNRQGLRKIKTQNLYRPLKINLGSGRTIKKGFLNIDLLPGADLTLDLRNPLPFESNSCELIFSEHFFEHVQYPGPVTSLFKECHRILKPGGILKFSVPDTEWPLKAYATGPDADYFRACLEHNWHPSDCQTMIEHINFHFRQNGQHCFAYDYETAKKALHNAGFRNIMKDLYDPELDSPQREIGSLFLLARKE